MSAILLFLRSHWKAVAILLVIAGQAFVINQYAGRLDKRRGQLELANTMRQLERASHRLTKANFRQAMTQAKLDNLAAVRATEAKQALINQRSDIDVQGDLAALRGRYDEWVRRSLTGASGGAVGGGAGQAGLPRLSIPASLAAGAPVASGPVSARGQPDALGRVCIDAATALRLSEDGVRHDRLITWAIGQAAVDPNAPPPK